MPGPLPADARPWVRDDDVDAQTKRQLFNAAYFGWARPLPNTPMGQELLRFTQPDSPEYDETYAEDFKQLRPSWFDASRGNELAGSQRAIMLGGLDDQATDVRESIGTRMWRWFRRDPSRSDDLSSGPRM